MLRLYTLPAYLRLPICGATRWLNDTPLMRLTGARYNRNDSFWFTFFHEAGPYSAPWQKGYFLREVEYSDKDMVKRKRRQMPLQKKWILTEEEEKEIIAAAPLNTDQD